MLFVEELWISVEHEILVVEALVLVHLHVNFELRITLFNLFGRSTLNNLNFFNYSGQLALSLVKLSFLLVFHELLQRIVNFVFNGHFTCTFFRVNNILFLHLIERLLIILLHHWIHRQITKTNQQRTLLAELSFVPLIFTVTLHKIWSVTFVIWIIIVRSKCRITQLFLVKPVKLASLWDWMKFFVSNAWSKSISFATLIWHLSRIFLWKNLQLDLSGVFKTIEELSVLRKSLFLFEDVFFLIFLVVKDIEYHIRNNALCCFILFSTVIRHLPLRHTIIIDAEWDL